MKIKEMIDCIVKGMPVEYKGIRCIPIGYGARADRRTGAVKREFVLLEENSKVDCSHIVSENGVKFNTNKCEAYKVADVEHRIGFEDIKMIDSIVNKYKEHKEREEILSARTIRN